MKIAYIAGYQGPGLIKRRSIKKNRALAGTQKITMVTRTLLKKGNDIKILSHGINAASNFKYDCSFSETLNLCKDVNVTYASSFSCKGLNVIVSAISLFHLFMKENKNKRFDLVIIYNLALPEVTVAYFALLCKIPVLLEYEDSAFVSRYGRRDVKSFFRKIYLSYIIPKISGCFAPSPELLNEINSKNSYLLRGIVDERLIELVKNKKIKKENIVLYAGSHTKSKGIDLLLQGWVENKVPGWELHIFGLGLMTEELKRKYSVQTDIIFHGYVSNQRLYSFLAKAKICINPHRDISSKGNIFPFKLIEYIAADSHVISSRMGMFEPELESAITYLSDFEPETINKTIRSVVGFDNKNNNNAIEYVLNNYSLKSVSNNLDVLIRKTCGM